MKTRGANEASSKATAWNRENLQLLMTELTFGVDIDGATLSALVR